MCGIAGSIGAPALSRDGLAAQFRHVLAHRGPDGFGSWQESDVALLHWRLAVIDLTEAGRQPMVSQDGRFVISYNGEIYNVPDLRATIEERWERAPASGADAMGQPLRRWRGHSDTEVVVEGVAQLGLEFLAQLNGMFALALYDRHTGHLHLARDRAGIKPLYIWARDPLVLFASEAKFFFSVPDFSAGVDARGLTAFFTYGNGYGDSHVLAGVGQLDPGEVVTIVRAGPERPSTTLTRARLAPPPRWRRPVVRSDEDAVSAVQKLLPDVVARQLVADVPVGVLLSGGVDSSILASLAARHLGPSETHAFTLGYPGMGADYDEIAHARRVARHLGIQHHVYEASQDDLIAELERLVWHYDEPFADAAALNVLVLSRMIRSRVTVALAGEGADELFGGYRRYQSEKTIRALGAVGLALCAAVRRSRADRLTRLPRRVAAVLRAMARNGAPERYSSYLESDVSAAAVLKPEWCRAASVHPVIKAGYPDELDTDPVGRLCVVDQQFWLPSVYLEKSDKGSMAHGLELRVPFLDNAVVEFANSLPDNQRIRRGQRKWLLAQAFRDALPAEVFSRFKRGFGVPVAHWLRHELREYYIDTVLAPGSRVDEFLQMSRLEAWFKEHLKGERDHTGLLWKCLLLEIWLQNLERRFKRDAPPRPAAATSPAHATAPRAEAEFENHSFGSPTDFSVQVRVS